MPFSVSMCKELCFQKRCKVSNTPIDNIEQVSSLKILGITFQNNSSFNEQIRNKRVILHSTDERSHWIKDNMSNPNLNNSILL